MDPATQQATDPPAEKADTAAISGLYSYHKTTLIEKLAYAKAF